MQDNGDDHELSTLERTVEGMLIASRWMLIPVFAGLIFVLVALIVSFYQSGIHLFETILESDKKTVVIAILNLIDMALIAGLVVMVAMSGYENFISTHSNVRRHRPSIFARLDQGTIKIKLAMSIIAISSIKMLQIYMDIEKYDPSALMWTLLMHLAFIISGGAVAVIQKVADGVGRSNPSSKGAF